MDKRHTEEVLKCGAEYTFIVKLRRYLHDDLPIVEEKFGNLSLEEALKRQLVEELQEACDTGLATVFEVIDGPNFPLET